MVESRDALPQWVQQIAEAIDRYMVSLGALVLCAAESGQSEPTCWLDL
ncbi:MAG: hypothetical protein ACOX2L_01665 [Anaerolineae bacterium]|jgi:hypothetical protein|nr:hypothetical protein [Chloroflexota bacterium]